MMATEPVSTEVVFSCHDITKVYGSGASEVHALRGVTLELYAGQISVLLGPSGSGKSTFLNIIGGLDKPTSGYVEFEGQRLNDLDESGLTAYRRESVGFVFQFYNLIPSLTALENVALVTEIAEDPMAPEDALDVVNLKPRMNHFPSELSGGEQQRVAIARAIAKRPQVLLCDEPTGALDSKTGIVVIQALVDVNAQLGTTTALITHNVAIRKIADRVIHFRDGQVQEIEQIEEKITPSELRW
jgi:putative ABC transport system ATP-binding protein